MLWKSVLSMKEFVENSSESMIIEWNLKKTQQISKYTKNEQSKELNSFKIKTEANLSITRSEASGY